MKLKVIFSALLAALSVSAVAQVGVPVDQAKASGLPVKPDVQVMQKAAAALSTPVGAPSATKGVPPTSLPSTSHRIIEAPKTAPVKQAPVTMKKIVTTAADGPDEDEEIAPAPVGAKPPVLPNIGGGAPAELRNAIAARINTAVDGTAAARLEDPAGPQPGELRNDIQVRAGVTEVVKISKAFLTRIITPFANPGAKTVNDMEVDVVGSTLYITPSTDEPAGLFIYDQDDPERAITLQLYPQDIPQRDISLRLVGSRPTQGGASGGAGRGEGKGAGADKSPQPYTTDIVDTLSEVAKGRVPTGFSLAKPLGNEADCVVPGAEVKLGQLIDGQRTKIAVLVLKNVSSKAIEVNEQSCYRAGVMGVAVWPNPVVDSGKETEIYVMLRHEEPSFDTGSTRPRLVK